MLQYSAINKDKYSFRVFKIEKLFVLNAGLHLDMGILLRMHLKSVMYLIYYLQ